MRPDRWMRPRVGLLGMAGLVVATTLPGCGDDDDDKTTSPTIAELVAGSGDFDTLEAALEAANLTATFEGPGPFTVFAPTDDAFAKIPEAELDALLADADALAAVLKYHVVSGDVRAAQVVTLDQATTLEGSTIAITVKDGAVYLNDTIKVTTTDLVAENGVVHVIDTVLMPPAEAPGSIADIVAGSDDFDTLEAALTAASLVATLDGPGPFTVFAPTDAAFEALPAGALDALLADADALADVLTYHVVSGEVGAATVVTLPRATALNGVDIKVEVVDGKVVLNGSVMVETTDVEADNGIIHVIDAVLLPPGTITDIVVASDDFDTLETAVVAADLAATLDGDTALTVFAPTDAAFAALPAGALDAILADEDRLLDVLRYHVTAGKRYAADVVAQSSLEMLNELDLPISVMDGKVMIGSAEITMTDIYARNGVIHVIDAVLVPPAPTPGTIADIVAASDDFETLYAAVGAAGLGATLAGAGPFTVFAPTDAAFEALPAGALDTLLADTEALTDVLTYHVVAGEVDAATVVTLPRATAVNGVDIEIEVVDGKVVLNGAVEVTVQDIEADNGIIHVIDAVLLPPASVLGIVAARDDLSTLETAVAAAGIGAALDGDEPVTLFAPTNAAIAALGDQVGALVADVPRLTDVLKYHVTAGKVYAEEVVAEDALTMLNGLVIPITLSGGTAKIGAATITTTDIYARNGVIHVIDAVLLPPPTIAEAAAATADLSTLVTALGAADLVDTLDGPGPFTVFAPTNAAFAAIPEADLTALLADTEGLTDVLLYHVTAGARDAANVTSQSYLTMANGAIVPIRVVDGKAMIGDAEITVIDIPARNGIIHLIDTVIVPPPSIAGIVAGDARFDTLLAAVSAAGLATTLDEGGPFTVFAPTDDAFTALPSGALADLLADVPALTDVLLYHVVDGVVPAAVAVTLTTATMKNGDAVSLAFDVGTAILSVHGATVLQADIWARNGVIHVVDEVLLPPAP
ncbi:MAG: fasciclin domain-containing protein [Deltaproteobacteria bacterium]|nr:fasciclin domain-containing protein [Deltaproteobacteria bacterium]